MWISREEALLLRCARTLSGDSTADVRDLIGDDLAWPVLIRSAGWHGLRPLVASHLRAAVAGGAALPALEELERAALSNARRNVALTAELLRLLDLLEREGIRVLPYKGPVLASTMYGSLALREFFDLDLLVRRADVAAASRVLEAGGYEPQFRLTRAQEASFLESRHEQVFVRDGRVVVELQWRVVPQYFSLDLDHDRLWERPEWVVLAGRKVATLRAEDLLPVLCVHGTKHIWERLIWIVDIAELLRTRPDLDWDEVSRLGRTLRVERMLGLGLRLARDLVGAILPAEVPHRLLDDPALNGLVRQTRQWSMSRPGGSPGVAWTAWYHMRARERLRDRIRYCTRLAVAPTPGDWAVARLPDVAFPLYYLVRAGRVALKYGKKTVRSAAKGATISE